ncbi:hypothetical protein DQ384_09390 [Sphaerisporangium album]|uniref:DUF4352 domain-containing protein n=1 Tax=Sphaerisporangium album TaxID=509200 RepID=A0A367FPJ3_9ACTN|nr:hypothetical protein [Sphaerisporangium album]RCG31742.1 hypothetical protein DQ384_09390 [Sphaerisporangium album]
MVTHPGFVPDAPARPSPQGAPRARVPVWRRVLGAIAGLALACGAVYVQSLVLTPDQLNDPITTSGGMHDELVTDRFSTRVERLEFARTVRVKQTYTTDEATTDNIFLIVKVGATTPRRPTRLDAHLLTADGLRFEPTDRVAATASMADKWVQPGWWRSGFFFFEVPKPAVAGLRLVVAEPETLFGDTWVAETSADLGLDETEAERMVGAAKDVYEVTG